MTMMQVGKFILVMFATVAFSGVTARMFGISDGVPGLLYGGVIGWFGMTLAFDWIMS